MLLLRCIATGKKNLPTQEAAQVKAKAYRKRFGSKMNVYQCKHCEYWHMGHPRHPDRRKP